MRAAIEMNERTNMWRILSKPHQWLSWSSILWRKLVLRLKRFVGQAIYYVPEQLARWAAMRRFSWRIDGKPDIGVMYPVPLIAWLNYHQHEILGKQCYWLGHRAFKNPLDAWIYQEIIFEVKPDIVVEFGNRYGGSTLFLACMCELVGHGRVLAVDLDHSPFTAEHPRIQLVTGDCSDERIIATIKEMCADKRVLIIHDADHSRDAVLRDLRDYAPLVSPGSYFIVEDSFHGIPGFRQKPHLPGSFLRPDTDTPLQATEIFIRENPCFVVDHSRERYILTANYRGFLKRIED